MCYRKEITREEFLLKYYADDCYTLATALSREYNLEIGVILTDRSSILMHAFVIFDDYAIDANGAIKQDQLLENYGQKVSDSDEGEGLVVETFGSEDGINYLTKRIGREPDFLDELRAISEFGIFYPELFE